MVYYLSFHGREVSEYFSRKNEVPNNYWLNVISLEDVFLGK